MLEETIQPQETETQVAEPVVAETPQPVEALDDDDLGAEEQPQEPKVEKPPEVRKYSQEEWSKRESELNKQTAQLQQHLAQINMQLELAKAQKVDEEAKARDQREVDEGSITSDEAEKRQEVRSQHKQTQNELVKQQQILRQMGAETEKLGKTLAAQDFGKQYELTPDQITELLNDKDIMTPGDMRAKAADLALERERGERKKVQAVPPRFDSGVSGTKGKAEPESAKGKIKAGWEEIARKNK